MLNRIALTFAWLSLIGVVAAGIGYVYLSEPPAQHTDATEDAEQQAAADPAQGTSQGDSDSESHGNETPGSEASENTAVAEGSDGDSTTQEDADTQTADHASAESEAGKTIAGAIEANETESATAVDPGRASASAPDATQATAPDKTAEASAVAQDAIQDTDRAGTEPDAAASATATEMTPQEPAPQSPADTADVDPAAAGNAKPENAQQAALPKVIAPDHNSLPLWKRNRQTIDRRWLKDSDGKPKPRIAFVLSELGHARIAAEEIIKVLPPAITLSFSPYANPRSLEYLSALARSNGHEVMLDLPLEPIDFPQRDPGPMALLTALEPKENLERLDWSLKQATGYVGVAVWMGSRFVGSPRQMRPLFEAVNDRGLIFLDNAEREDSLAGELAGEFDVPTIQSHRYVDVPLASRDAIDARLAQVERIALQFGSAVAMGRPFPVTVERLAEWAKEIEKRGIVLVPITVLAEEAVKKQRLAYQPPPEKSQPKAADPAEGSGTAAN